MKTMQEKDEPSNIPKMLSEIAILGNRLRTVFDAPETAKPLQEIYRAASQINSFYREVRDNFAPLLESIQKWMERENAGALVAQAGWLPHETTPIELLRSEMELAEVHEIISTFYAGNFDDVEATFIRNSERYRLDDQVASTIREALTCHRHGCYRATVRLLFPEIERVACAEFYGGEREGKASLPLFAAEVGRLPLGNFPQVEGPLRLYQKLEKHLYKTVRTDEALRLVSADPVPNRHAAIHGLVDYNSPQNSLNALIMADFIFQLFGCFKKLPSVGVGGENQFPSRVEAKSGTSDDHT